MAKYRPNPISQTSRRQETELTSAIESSQSPQPSERAVALSLDSLLQPIIPDRRRQDSSSKRSPTAPPSSFSSGRMAVKQSPLEHLSDMGPLETERGVDSGVVLNQDHPAVYNVRRISTTDSVSDPFLRDPLTSTLVSGLSSFSSNSTATTLTGQGRADTDHGTGGFSWSGDHPLLFDYTAEPESMDDTSYHTQGSSSSHPHDHSASSRHKGHTMSLSTTQETTPLQDPEFSFFASGSNARRRRIGPKGAEDRSWTSHTDKNQKQSNVPEGGGKRVIIHQVVITDTLAGIALNYGIQVSILKKSNKLWTNDSIHTRKYLYIPFEECSVIHQPGVVVDEADQSVMLPRRIQPSHERTGSSLPGAPFHGAQTSLFTTSPLSEHGSRLGEQSSHTGPTHLSSNSSALSGSMPDYGMSPPPISAIAAGMLPTSSGLFRSIPGSSASPRLGTWNEPKSMVAPPIASPTMTTTAPKSNNSLQASSLSPRRSTIASSSLTGASRACSEAVVFSEDLPNTVVVSPSMTHEALAARFKEMEFVSSEQQQRKSLAPEQELRTNPIHHRHRTTDLRQYAHLQQHQQKQQQQLDSGRNSIASSAAGSRRTSVDLDASEDGLSSAGGLLSRRGASFGQQEGSPGSLGDNPAIEEETEDVEVEGGHQPSNDEEFVAFGHQQHIYESDDVRPGGQGGHGSQPSERYEAGDPDWVQRRQEVVTVPAGMLSFFPSPEHSKKLETPQSISKLQSRIGSYPSGTLSSSSTGSGSPRGTFQERRGESTRSKGRTALSGDTFQAPTSATISSASPSSSAAATTTAPAPTAGGTTASTKNPTAKSTYSSTVRVHHQQYSPQNWSRMGETLVDDLLGAVRSKLQIARRMYDFTTFGFGTLGGSGGSYGKDSDPPDILRRTSSRGSRSRSQRNKEFRYSGSAIELDQAGVGSATASSAATRVKTSIVHRMPSSSSISNGMAVDTESHSSPRGVRRKPSVGSGHGRGASSGSNTSVGGGGSTRKRSLRSSNPINHPALMALVNELDKDKKDKEREEQEKNADGDGSGSGDTGSSLPVVDVLSTTTKR
ncbi:hypothetical protein BGX23_006284 [Mortierella sp. AD031]|nr:hypothetical protein BGX23_006284 [Mortierella sp. AD031]